MSKIKKYKELLSETRKMRKNWGFSYAFSFFSRHVNKKSLPKNRRMAIELLEKEYSSIFLKYKNLPYEIEREENRNLFLYWATGFETAPEIVTLCVEHVKKFYPEYQIHLLSDENIAEYVHLDERILKYHKEGKITVQTFSDILRFNLLYEYGGYWIDSSVLFLGKLPLDELLLEHGFYSLNHQTDFFRDVYDVTWTTYFLGCDRKNPNMGAIVEIYNEYYQKHDYAIDYFMTDYLLCLCSKYGIGNDQLKRIPSISSDPFLLDRYLSGKEIDQSMLSCCPQKITWKYEKEKVEKLKTFIKEMEG